MLRSCVPVPGPISRRTDSGYDHQSQRRSQLQGGRTVSKRTGRRSPDRGDGRAATQCSYREARASAGLCVDQPIGEIRGVVVAKDDDRCLILSRDGKWYKSTGNKVVQNSNEWRYYFLSEIVKGFEETFIKAIATKATHLVAVEKRRDLLNRVGAVISGEAVPAAAK